MTDVPGEVEAFLRLQLAAARDDAGHLAHATARLRSMLDAGRLQEAATAARAWAAYAGGIARRLDELMAYRAGAAAVVAGGGEPLPATLYASRALAGPVVRRPSPGRHPRRFDCGPHGWLTADQMAARTGLHVHTVRALLRQPVAPVEIMERRPRGAPVPASGATPEEVAAPATA